jgi:hypothetical protein
MSTLIGRVYGSGIQLTASTAQGLYESPLPTVSQLHNSFPGLSAAVNKHNLRADAPVTSDLLQDVLQAVQDLIQTTEAASETGPASIAGPVGPGLCWAPFRVAEGDGRYSTWLPPGQSDREPFYFARIGGGMNHAAVCIARLPDGQDEMFLGIDNVAADAGRNDTRNDETWLGCQLQHLHPKRWLMGLAVFLNFGGSIRGQQAIMNNVLSDWTGDNSPAVEDICREIAAMPLDSNWNLSEFRKFWSEPRSGQACTGLIAHTNDLTTCFGSHSGILEPRESVRVITAFLPGPIYDAAMEFLVATDGAYGLFPELCGNIFTQGRTPNGDWDRKCGVSLGPSLWGGLTTAQAALISMTNFLNADLTASPEYNRAGTHLVIGLHGVVDRYCAWLEDQWQSLLDRADEDMIEAGAMAGGVLDLSFFGDAMLIWYPKYRPILSGGGRRQGQYCWEAECFPGDAWPPARLHRRPEVYEEGTLETESGALIAEITRLVPLPDVMDVVDLEMPLVQRFDPHMVTETNQAFWVPNLAGYWAGAVLFADEPDAESQSVHVFRERLAALLKDELEITDEQLQPILNAETNTDIYTATLPLVQKNGWWTDDFLYDYFIGQ